MVIKCPKCQFENPDDTIYCGRCEALLRSSEKVSVTKTLKTLVRGFRKGTVIAGKYKIIEKLGEGGMGVVYKAKDTRLERTVALKFLSPDLTRDSNVQERFIQEAKAASAIEHNNVCNIYEIDGTEDGQVFIAMAYYPGESLRERIEARTLEANEVIDIVLQIAEGLSKAHQKGIIHRDIKPGNIMVTSDGVVKILDFGIAKLAGQVKLTRTGSTVGTVAYMSPEQAKGGEVDQRTDIWSLGVILYEMISGRLPFKGEHDQAVLYSILNKEPAPVKGLPYEVPEDLERIMKKALAKDPEKRYVSGGELAEALQRLKSELISGVSLATRKQIFRGTRRRKLIVGAVSVFALAAILFTWMMTRPSLAFSERDKLLVADVDNQTEEEIFDLALRTAIEADLQQSPYASIFDKGQVTETLRLMRKDPSSRIDEELGCDICRFSGVRALILPRIFSAGDAYELQAIIIDPVKRRQVDRIRVTALGREQVLLSAVDGLASKVRSRLGESIDSIEKADVPVVKVTTSSWETLDFLAKGLSKQLERRFKEAAAFYELALKKDPKCATAEGALGLALIQFLGQKEKGKELLNQALEDAKDLPQREYLKLKAFKRQFVDEDLEGALDEYRIITELYPDLWSAYNNSGMILRSLGRYDEAVEMFEKSAEVAAILHFPLGNLWWTHLQFRKDPRAAEEVAQRLISFAPDIAIHFQYYGFTMVARHGL